MRDTKYWIKKKEQSIHREVIQVRQDSKIEAMLPEVSYKIQLPVYFYKATTDCRVLMDCWIIFSERH